MAHVNKLEVSTDFLPVSPGYPKCPVVALTLTTQLALSVIGTLALLHIGSGWLMGTSMSIAFVPSLLCYICNRSAQKEPGAILQQYIIGIVGITIGILGMTGTLGSTQLGIAALSLAGSALILGICSSHNGVRQVENQQSSEGVLLSDTDFAPSTSCLCVQFMRKIIGLLKDIFHSIQILCSRFTHRQNYTATIEPVKEEIREEEALCVLIHGLNGHPSTFDCYHDSFSSLSSKNITLYQPHVPNKGQCSLEEAAGPILEEIAGWARSHPMKPVSITGVSNGARISGYIATRLREMQIDNPLLVSCISGPLSGTKMVNQPHLPSPIRHAWQWGVRKLNAEVVYEELSWESEKSKEVISGLQKTSKYANTFFHFYTTYGDTLIYPFNSACPKVEGASYFTVTTEGHNSVIRAVREPIINASLEFIERY